jgi:hypothetical protein
LCHCEIKFIFDQIFTLSFIIQGRSLWEGGGGNCPQSKMNLVLIRPWQIWPSMAFLGHVFCSFLTSGCPRDHNLRSNFQTFLKGIPLALPHSPLRAQRCCTAPNTPSCAAHCYRFQSLTPPPRNYYEGTALLYEINKPQ